MDHRQKKYALYGIIIGITILSFIGLVFVIPNLLPQERTAKVIVTEEENGIYQVEIHQRRANEIQLKYVEFYYIFSVYPSPGGYTYKKVFWDDLWVSGVSDSWKASWTIDLIMSVDFYKKKGTIIGTAWFVFDNWKTIEI